MAAVSGSTTRTYHGRQHRDARGSGLDVATELHHHRQPSTKVLIVTTFARRGSVERAMDAGSPDTCSRTRRSRAGRRTAQVPPVERSSPPTGAGRLGPLRPAHRIGTGAAAPGGRRSDQSRHRPTTAPGRGHRPRLCPPPWPNWAPATARRRPRRAGNGARSDPRRRTRPAGRTIEPARVPQVLPALLPLLPQRVRQDAVGHERLGVQRRRAVRQFGKPFDRRAVGSATTSGLPTRNAQSNSSEPSSPRCPKTSERRANARRSIVFSRSVGQPDLRRSHAALP